MSTLFLLFQDKYWGFARLSLFAQSKFYSNVQLGKIRDEAATRQDIRKMYKATCACVTPTVTKKGTVN